MTDPTRAFTELSASTIQKIDVTDGFAMARAMLQSESRVSVQNILNMQTLNGAYPPAVVRHIDNSAPPMSMPSSGTPAEITRSIMEQMQARMIGSREQHIFWGMIGSEMGDMRITLRGADMGAFSDQMSAIDRLRTNLQTRVVTPMLNPAYIDPLSGIPAAGNEQAVKTFFTQNFVDVVREYQDDIQRATSGGTPSIKLGIDYRGPTDPDFTRPEGQLQGHVEAIAAVFDAYAQNLPASLADKKPAVRPSGARPE